MARRLTDMLGELAAVHHEARRLGIPADEIFERRIERREFLRRAALTGAGAAIGPSLLAACISTGSSGSASSPRAGEGGPSIVVVGAGLAGMTTAYRLWKAGYKPMVYEASERIGGRTNTIRDFFDHGQTAEACGEYVNSDHTAMRNLAVELGLEQDNLWSYYDWSNSGLRWIDHKPYSQPDVFADFQEIYPALHRDFKAVGWPVTFDKHTDAGVELDNMTLTEWLDRNVPGGMSSRFAKLVAVGYAGEYGLDADQQSAINLLAEMGFSMRNKLRFYGDQDWKWRIHGGNDMVAKTIGEQLPGGSVKLASPLSAMVKNSDGTYTLTFDQGEGGTTDVGADRVVLALPFTTMRFVDYSKAGFDDLKRRSIENLGMGTNAKLHMQFTKRVWEDQGLTGDTTTDLPFQETTIVYPTPKYEGGMLDIYTGGAAGASYESAAALGPAPKAIAEKTLSQLEAIMPGAKAAWNGKAHLHYCIADPWMLGSYSCPMPGEYTSIYGSEQLPQGGVHFAGEHTSIQYPGFMNGAVESGERAASELMDELRTR